MQVMRVRLHARHADVTTTAAVGGGTKLLALLQRWLWWRLRLWHRQQ